MIQHSKVDVHAYLAELEDIPGTRIYTAAQARRGYWINQFAMSLMKPENRERFKKDEREYLQSWPLPKAAVEALLARDFNSLLDQGGNIYFLAKLISTDGLSVAQGVSTMTGMSFEDYSSMMLDGGRKPEGNRSIRENLAAAAAAKGSK